MKTYLSLILFLLLSITEIFGDFTNNDSLIFATKPLLMPTLLVWFMQNVTGYSSTFKKQIAVAIVCGFFGDTFLLFVPDNEIFFLLGLGSFLVGQVLYGFAFIRNRKTEISQPKNYLNLILISFSAVYSILMSVLFNHLGEFLIPVLVYAAAICFMGTTAALRLKHVSAKSFVLILSGALIFVISDTLIALDKFYFKGGINNGQAFIMLTYCLAQCLIVSGSITHIKNSNS